MSSVRSSRRLVGLENLDVSHRNAARQLGAKMVPFELPGISGHSLFFLHFLLIGCSLRFSVKKCMGFAD